jgi:DNA-binding PadR family transcriptional regulator
MKYPETIGQFEQVVLAAILALDDRAYGVTIHTKVEEFLAPKSASLGAVYATLDRLEDKRLVKSWLSDPTPERGGRSKRHYRVEPAGERALRDSARAAKRICDDLERIWGADAWTAGSRWRPVRQP